MTLEASLVLPIFIFFILSIGFLMEIVRVQIHIGAALGQTSKEIARYGYIYCLKNKDIINNDKIKKEKNKNKYFENGVVSVSGLLYAASRMEELAGKEYLDSSIVVNGSRGVTLIGSQIMKDGKWIDLVASYEVRLPFSIIPNMNFKIHQHMKTHAWIGFIKDADTTTDKDKIVYMTEYGSVYHLNRNCKHLNISVSSVKSEYLKRARNESGGKYYCCPRCASDSKEVYYITPYGNNYHTTPSCTAILRNIIEKSFREVDGVYHCCKDCGG